MGRGRLHCAASACDGCIDCKPQPEYIAELQAQLAAAEARAEKWERWAKCVRYNPSSDVQRACGMADKFAARAGGGE